MRRTPEEEAAAAAYYEQHKDDPDIWEDDPDQPPVGVRRLTGIGARITARFSPEETALLRQYGRERGLPYPQAVHAAVMETVSRPTRPKSSGSDTKRVGEFAVERGPEGGVRIGATLDEDEADEVLRLADAEGIPVPELVREALRAYVRGHTHTESTAMPADAP